MRDGTASRTAVTAALMRATHTRVDRPQLIDDPWGDRLVSSAEKTALWQRIMEGAGPDARRRLDQLPSPRAVVDVALRTHATYGGVIIRTRYAEDALARAIVGGVRQYVLIGSGFDSFIVRQPALARAIQIFEIDHPASQAMKRERLAACAAEIPANVHFVAADLSQESLAAALARSEFSRTTPAFFAWLGVTIYLSREANLATLASLATASARGSEIVFNYIEHRALEETRSATLNRIREGAAALGEPWLSGFDPATLDYELRGLGLDLIEDLGGAALRERYCAQRTDGLTPGVFGHIARARVAPESNLTI